MISDLYIQATTRSPEVSMSSGGRIKISGRCIPENPDEFFAPVMDWVTGYCLEPAEETVIDISIEMISGTNSGKLYWFLKKLKEVTSSGKKVTVKYTYEEDDEQMYHLAMFWAEQLKLPVEMIPVETLDLPEMKKAPFNGTNSKSAE